METKACPKSFVYWCSTGFGSGASDAVKNAVQAWIRDQRQKGVEIKWDFNGNTQFEECPHIGGDPDTFLVEIKMFRAEQENVNPDDLFLHENILLGPQWNA